MQDDEDDPSSPTSDHDTGEENHLLEDDRQVKAKRRDEKRNRDIIKTGTISSLNLSIPTVHNFCLPSTIYIYSKSVRKILSCWVSIVL